MRKWSISKDTIQMSYDAILSVHWQDVHRWLLLTNVVIYKIFYSATVEMLTQQMIGFTSVSEKKKKLFVFAYSKAP